MSVDDRGGEPTTGRRNADTIVSFLQGIRTIRRFRSEPVSQQVVEDVLEVARRPSSAMNLQPREFIVGRDRGTLRDLAGIEGYAGHQAGAAVAIVLVISGERAEQETFDKGGLSERISLADAAHGVGPASPGSLGVDERQIRASSRCHLNAWCEWRSL